MKQKFTLLFFCIICSHLAQGQIKQLLDSLTFVSSDTKKIVLSHQIATKLKDTDWKRALQYISYAHKLAQESEEERIIAKNNEKTAEFYYSKDALDIALIYYLKAYNYYKSQPNNSKKLSVENNLAIVYTRLKKDSIALRHFTAVLKTAKKIKDSVASAQVLNNLGTIFLQPHPEKSLHYYKKALAIATQYQNQNLKAYLHANLGRNYTLLRQPDSAIIAFGKALTIVRQQPSSDQTKIWVYKATAEFYSQQKSLDSTIRYSKKTMTLTPRYSFNHQDAIKLLYEALLAQGHYKKAAHYYQIYNQVRDSLNIEKKLTNVERLLIEQNYKNKARLEELNDSKQQFIYFAIGLSLLVLLLISFSIIAHFKHKLNRSRLQNDLMSAKRKEQEAIIELNNKKLISKTMMTIKRNETIQEILDELKQIKRKAVKKETKVAIDVILHQIGFLNKEKNWKEFQLSFEKVYTSFFQKLHLEHPDLTIREKRLCALLKLGLTTKEISQLSGQSLKSVENGRTRLRKKLGLTNTKTDLSAYLFKFS